MGGGGGGELGLGNGKRRVSREESGNAAKMSRGLRGKGRATDEGERKT